MGLGGGNTTWLPGGSEYKAVIIPITMQSYMMLKRNLIYTAVTRGKKLVVVIGQKKALTIAVKDNKSSRRYTKLKEWLQRGFEFLQGIDR